MSGIELDFKVCKDFLSQIAVLARFVEEGWNFIFLGNLCGRCFVGSTYLCGFDRVSHDGGKLQGNVQNFDNSVLIHVFRKIKDAKNFRGHNFHNFQI